MTWRETGITLALWIGVCLVLFYGSWPVLLGAVLIAAIADRLYVQRINQAREQGFEIGKQSVKPTSSLNRWDTSPHSVLPMGAWFGLGGIVDDMV